MFPWIPFLSIRASKRRRHRRLGQHSSSLCSVWLNTGNPEVRVEYLAGYSYSAVSAASTSQDIEDDRRSLHDLEDRRRLELEFEEEQRRLEEEFEEEERRIQQELENERPSSVPPEESEAVPQKKISLQTPLPTSRPNSRASPRSGSAANSRPSSRPNSAQPPPQQNRNVNRNARSKMFETSAAMRELFGGAPPSPRVKREEKKPAKEEKHESKKEESKKEESIQNLQVHQNGIRIEEHLNETTTSNGTVTKKKINVKEGEQSDKKKVDESPNNDFDEVSIRSGHTEDSGINSAASCFHRIPSPPPTTSGPSQFARSNALEREATPGQWEEVPSTSYSTTSSFHNVPNHDLAYENARRRGRGRSQEPGFNIITHQPTNQGLFQPGPEIPVEIGISSPRRLRNRNDQIELGAPGRALPDDESESASPETAPEPLQHEIQALDTRTAENGPECGLDERRRESGLREEGAENGQRKESVVNGERRESEGKEESARNGKISGKAESGPAKANGECSRERAPPPSVALPFSGGCGGGGGAAPLDPTQLNHNGLATLLNDENRKPSELGTVQERLRRLILASSEDGCGMVAASGSNGGAGANPIFIRGGQIVNDDALFPADIFIEDGVIKQILPNLEVPAGAEVIDASGKWILPAGIDVHTEFSTGLSADEFLNCSRAAVVGGTATVIDIVFPGLNESLSDAVERVKKTANTKALCNVAFSVSLQKWSDEIRKEVDRVVKEKKINSFVLEMQSDSELFEALTYLKSIGALGRIYPENKEMITMLEKKFSELLPSQAYLKARPVELESDRINHVCIISKQTNSPITILSASSADSYRSISAGRQQGALVFAEVPISALSADLSHPTPSQSRIPVRKGEEHAREALELISNGQLTVCTSGHRTPREHPSRPPYGVVAVGERLSVLWEKAVASGQIDLMRFVAVTASNPAKLFNLYPRKGRISVGADADLVIWNGQTTKTIGCLASSAIERGVFDGITVHAVPEVTLCSGQVIFRNGKIEQDRPVGNKVISLEPDAPHVFSVVKLREKTFALAKPATPERKDSNTGQSSSGMFVDRNLNKNADLTQKSRAATKVIHPPGGKSNFW